MKHLDVISEKCIACGKCYLNYPTVFDCTDDGIAFVKEANSLDQQVESERAIYECPTRAIIKLKSDETTRSLTCQSDIAENQTDGEQ